MKHLLWLLTLGAWLVSGVALATEGGLTTTATNAALAAEKATSNTGTSVVQRYLVCDRNPDDAETCGAFDTLGSGKLGTPSRARSAPRISPASSTVQFSVTVSRTFGSAGPLPR